MDADAALQLTKAMNDRESFKLLFLVYKSGIKTDAKAFMDPKSFETLINTDMNEDSRVLAQEVVIADQVDQFKHMVEGSFKVVQDHGAAYENV